ncbi:Heat shock protein 15 [Candidatus Magnetaquicoccaceae bacterium FCR-1]|uniref:Heat shock protein 15 n=1 Tax=Candidatus Magnetaquiglobus chichijimensis TaxID=3141448 RepID=A0ABQ0C5C0_9PROT
MPTPSRGLPPSPDDPASQVERLDKWLWAARFFKTRSLAIEAANGGKIHVNGLRAKPGRDIRVGDRLEIRKESFLFQVTVLTLSLHRGPATVARNLYEESPESLAERARIVEIQRAEPRMIPGAGRPTKKDRRAIVRFLSHPGGPPE